MTDLRVYIESLQALYDSPKYEWHFSALFGKDLFENLKAKNFPELTTLSVERMLDSIVRNWNKAHPEKEITLNENKLASDPAFWLFLLETAWQIRITYHGAINPENLEREIRQLEKAIESLESAKDTIGSLPFSRVLEHQYYVDLELTRNKELEKLDILKPDQDNQRLYKVDIFQILEINALRLRERLNFAIEGSISWTKLAKKKSGKLDKDRFGTRLATLKCGEIMHEKFGRYLYRTTARLVAVSLGKQVSEAWAREVLRKR